MRFSKILLAFFSLALFFSCQKEYSLESGLSVGTLSKDGAGSCLPSSVIGVYKKDTVLTAANYIEVQLNLTETGAYIISSDTVNGYSFYGAGTIDVPGMSTVRINGRGKPLAEGINTFTVTYGSSTCMIDVTVISVGPSGAYTLTGAGSTCTGATVGGVYAVGIPTSSINTATVGVNVTTPGSYSISTPVVNGVSFSGSGNFTTTGAQTVVLTATGTPVAAGDHNYAPTASGGSCTFSVTVVGTPGTAVYTLGGAGSACTGFVSAGTYAVGTALTPSNTVTINVNVTTPGAYTISTTAANGVTFSKIGIFTATGAQTVVLTGTGTPTAAGAINHTVNGTPGTCTFSITYTGATTGNAVFTTSGAPAACTVATPAGTYASGTALTAANTVTVQVNVTSLGTYTLSTNTVNGVSFSKTGSFTTLGNQNVVLQGTGTPLAAGAQTYTVGTNGCTFSITYTGPTTGNAVFTTSGAPAACTVATPAGTYASGTALTAANTVTVQVNVTTLGTYSLTTNTVNGVSFSKSGSFTTLGNQNVVLQGTGTPIASGAHTYTVGTNGCTFSITFTGTTTPTDIFRAKINNVLVNFPDAAEGFYYTPLTDVAVEGYVSAASSEGMWLNVDKETFGPQTPVTPGTYTNAGSAPNVYTLLVEYADVNGDIWAPRQSVAGTPDPFTVTITTLTATRIIGTFSGTLRSDGGTGTQTKTVTEGVFNLPIN